MCCRVMQKIVEWCGVFYSVVYVKIVQGIRKTVFFIARCRMTAFTTMRKDMKSQIQQTKLYEIDNSRPGYPPSAYQEKPRAKNAARVQKHK